MGATLTRKITVRGVVQGVGFRPFVYRIAHKNGLTGWVMNTSGGVKIEVEGDSASLNRFLGELETQTPPLARIEGVQVQDGPPNGYSKFEIRHSQARKDEFQSVSPDVATCPDCLRELMDPQERRYRYPFTNCTNCGPRFTIIQDLPYDRPLTTMRAFPLCPSCHKEYQDPLDRRFHAQPVACPACGPHVELVTADGHRVPVPDAIRAAAALLQQGCILAVKGLGGFHLACDASSDAAVRSLRERKGRPHKPLAIMVSTAEEVKRVASVSEKEEALLASRERPIVLLRRREGSSISPLVAPHNAYLGVLLPYTPLHHLLLREVDRPLVMTSGNRGEEPLAVDNREARERLREMADYFLWHNREIEMRCDDSVWMMASHAIPIRRSRGYAPLPIPLTHESPQVLGCGAELKNTFCLTKGRSAFLSQHIGDLVNLETLEHFRSSLAHFERLFRIEPEVVAHDLHPDYLSTRYALELAQERQFPHVPIQHHHAHIASCLVDNGLREPVIGVAFDGTGYGLDGQIWGGEFLLADLAGFRRAGHLQYMPLPGGELAIRNPFRLAAAYLLHLFEVVPDLPFLEQITDSELALLKKQVERGLNTPLTSSMGRLYDVVAAILGLRDRVTYEGQAATELEAVSWRGRQKGAPAYPFSIQKENGVYIIGLSELLGCLAEDVQKGDSPGDVGWRFHRTVAAMIREVCRALAQDTGITQVALSGGVFQNRLLLEETVAGLSRLGLEVYTHRQVPANDGGISLGQAAVAGVQAAQLPLESKVLGRVPCA